VKVSRHQNTTHRYAWDYRSVAPTVGHMSYERLAYDDQDTAVQMHDDCLVCASHIRIPHDALVPELSELTASDAAPRRQHQEIEVSDATADLASRLYVD
jgi:hypothetical protein